MTKITIELDGEEVEEVFDLARSLTLTLKETVSRLESIEKSLEDLNPKQVNSYGDG